MRRKTQKAPQKETVQPIQKRQTKKTAKRLAKKTKPEKKQGQKSKGTRSFVRGRGKNFGVPGDSPVKPIKNPQAPGEEAGTEVREETPSIEEKHANRKQTKAFEKVFRRGKKLRSDAKPPSDSLIKAICQVIRQGNYPEVAARAFGVRNYQFRDWAKKGFEDIAAGHATPYSTFVMAVDMADAQAETADIKLIRQGIENWQAVAWLRERKSFKRWGMRSLQLSGDITDALSAHDKREALPEPLAVEETAEILAALEEAGIAAVSGEKEFSGAAEISAIKSGADGEEEIATMPD